MQTMLLLGIQNYQQKYFSVTPKVLPENTDETVIKKCSWYFSAIIVWIKSLELQQTF